MISTALPQRQVIIGIGRNFDDHPFLPSSESQEKSDNDIMRSIRLSIQDVRREWDLKIEKLTNAIEELRLTTGLGGSMSDDGAVFDQLLDLFTQSYSAESNPIANLQRLYSHHPETVEFYIPQLVVFLLYGSFDVTSLLQEAIFRMCEASLSFAHKIHWFVVAFCLSGAGVAPEGVVALHRLLQDIESHGMISARRIKDGLANTSGSPSQTHEYGEGEEKMSLLRYEHGPNILHHSSTSAYFHSILEKCIPLPDALNEFTVTIAFWETLSELSSFLGSIPRDIRTEELRIRLDPIRTKYFPSSTIYSPVTGNGQHRIFGIQIDESFSFSTKERAPLFICLEILEMTPQQKRYFIFLHFSYSVEK